MLPHTRSLKPFPVVCTSIIFPSSCLTSHSSSSSSSAPSVLLKFRTDKSRDPDPQSFPEDSELLKQIRDDVLAAMKVNGDLLSDEFTRYTALWCVINSTHKWTHELVIVSYVSLHVVSLEPNGASLGGEGEPAWELQTWIEITFKNQLQSVNFSLCLELSWFIFLLERLLWFSPQTFCLVTPALLVLSHCFSEMSPVCAVVGGVLGQEVVKVSLKTSGSILRSQIKHVLRLHPPVWCSCLIWFDLLF